MFNICTPITLQAEPIESDQCMSLWSDLVFTLFGCKIYLWSYFFFWISDYCLLYYVEIKFTSHRTQHKSNIIILERDVRVSSLDKVFVIQGNSYPPFRLVVSRQIRQASIQFSSRFPSTVVFPLYIYINKYIYVYSCWGERHLCYKCNINCVSFEVWWVFCLASHTSYGLLETRMKSIL